MKIINPYKDSDIPPIKMNELFMLWCPETKVYHSVTIANWYDKLVIRDTQSNDDDLAFTIAKRNSRGSDLYRSIGAIVEVLQTKNYAFNYKGSR